MHKVIEGNDRIGDQGSHSLVPGTMDEQMVMLAETVDPKMMHVTEEMEPLIHSESTSASVGLLSPIPPTPSTRPLALCVDDNPLNLRLLVRRAEKCGFDHLEAESGEEAVHQMAISPSCPDIVFMDYHLPGINGIQAIREVRALAANRWGSRCRQIIWVICSADDSSVLQQSLHQGEDMVELCRKPFGIERVEEYHDKCIRAMALHQGVGVS